MAAPLRLGNFGGGVVIEGSADQRRITELSLADGWDIGSRGALTATTGPTDYVTLRDGGTSPAVVSKLFGFVPYVRNGTAEIAAFCRGISGTVTPAYLFDYFARTGASSPITPILDQYLREKNDDYSTTPAIVAPRAEGVVCTSAIFAGAFEWRDSDSTTVQNQLFLVNLGAREGFAPRTAPGLYAFMIGASIINSSIFAIGGFGSLGTGPFVLDVIDGTLGKQLYPRGIAAYNNHVFAWGFDEADAIYGEGPNRVMFCNLGDPLTWGNDNQADAGTDRDFTDSDAITLGDAGELIRAACVWNGRLWFGTNRGLHFISGYGRESFLTNGATPVMKAYNVLGPGCLIEGPDRMLYGVGDQGLWKFDGGGVPENVFDKLRDQNGFSAGYWDCIWTDDSAPLGAYPGKTNADLVWMAVDWEQQQVLVGIPWCDAAAGYGPGEDTLLLKYHVRTGGFTRQVFEDVQYSAAGYFRREAQGVEVKYLGTATSGEATVQNYGYKANQGDAPILCDPLPAVTFGPYAVFGPEGHGVLPRCYLTLSWQDSGSLPLVFECVVTVDNVSVSSFTLTVGPTAPVGPSAGDVWLDTSQSSTAIGNGTAATGIAAAGGYLVYTRNASAWVLVPGQGATGTRATIPIPVERRMGTRAAVTLECTAAAGRFTLEGVGFGHLAGVPAA